MLISSDFKTTFSFTILSNMVVTSYDLGLVHTLLFQCFKICSSRENVHIEVEQVEKVFSNAVTNLLI